MKVIGVVGALLAAAVAASAAASEPACLPRFDLFAPNSTDSGACGRDGTCNFPAAWTRPSQEKGGNDVATSGVMYGVAIDQYGSTNPTIYFALRHPLLVKAGAPVAECGPGGAGVAEAPAPAPEPEVAAAEEEEQAAPVDGAAAVEEGAAAAPAEEQPAPEPQQEEEEPRLTLDPEAAEAALAAMQQQQEEAAAAAAAEAEAAEEPAAEAKDPAAAPKSTRRRLMAPSPDAKPATAATPAAAAAAKAADAAAKAAPATVTVQQPPKYTATYSLDGGPWGPVANADGQTTFSSADANAKPPMVGVPAQLQDGEHCLTLKATLLANTGRLSTGESVPRQDQAVETTACFFRQSRQANATFAFDMCGASVGEEGSSGLVVNVGGITPPPIALTANGTAAGGDGQSAPRLLLQPLVKVWGTKVRNIDGTPSDGGYDQGAQQGATYFIKYAAVGPADAAATTEEGEEGDSNSTANAAAADGASLTIALDEAGKRLDEGYYRVNGVVSLLTDVPSLVDLNGLTRIQQRDQAGSEAGGGGVSGKWEAKSNMVLDGVVVGVQRSNTTLSAIKSASHSARDEVAPGQEIVLTWTFAGIGKAACYHDGQEMPAAPAIKKGGEAAGAEDAGCTSPLAFAAAEELGKGNEHNVTVVFTDVCGGEKRAEFSYSSKGVVAVTKPDQIAGGGLLEGGGAAGGSGLRLKSGAGAAAAVAAKGGALVAAALVGALLLAA